MNKYLVWTVLWSIVFIADYISVGWFISLLMVPPIAVVVLTYISMKEDE